MSNFKSVFVESGRGSWNFFESLGFKGWTGKNYCILRDTIDDYTFDEIVNYCDRSGGYMYSYKENPKYFGRRNKDEKLFVKHIFEKEDYDNFRNGTIKKKI